MALTSDVEQRRLAEMRERDRVERETLRAETRNMMREFRRLRREIANRLANADTSCDLRLAMSIAGDRREESIWRLARLIDEYREEFARLGVYCGDRATEGLIVADQTHGACASGTARVWASYADVYAEDNARVEAFGTSYVRAYGRAEVDAYGRTIVEAYERATVRCHERAVVQWPNGDDLRDTETESDDQVTDQVNDQVTGQVTGQVTDQVTGKSESEP